MFNLTALIKLVNTNNDRIIQQQEMKDFIKTQDSKNPSIFTEFFNSIKSDMSVEQFEEGMRGVIQQTYDSGNNEFDLNFKNEETAQNMNK